MKSDSFDAFVIVLVILVGFGLELCSCTYYDAPPEPDAIAHDAAPSSPPDAPPLAFDTEHCARTPPVDAICAAREGKALAYACLMGYTPRPDEVCFYLPGETEPTPDGVDNTCCCPPGEWPCP